MDYQSRKIEYYNLLKETDISGKEHLEVILENPDQYLKKVNELKQRASSDNFLIAEDREYILGRVNENIQKTTGKKSNFWNYALSFLAGLGAGYTIPHNTSNQTEFIEHALNGFRSEMERIKNAI